MTSHKEQPAVDTSAEKLLALAGRVRSYLNLQGGIQLTTLLQDCDATLRSLAAHPAEPELSELAKEVLPIIDPYLPADVYRIFETIDCHCNVIREDAPAVGDEAQCIRLGIREALALLNSERARAEKAEAALKQPVSDEEVERVAQQCMGRALFLRERYGTGEIKTPELLGGAAFLLRRLVRERDALSTQLRDAQARGKGMEEALTAERAAIEAEARRYAGHYTEGSDGRNTFLMLASWIADRAALSRPEGSAP